MLPGQYGRKPYCAGQGGSKPADGVRWLDGVSVFRCELLEFGGRVQNAKDTFYELLRGRLAALNPGRTVVVRGLTRPGVLVDENELGASAPLPDCFHLLWVSEAAETQGALPLVTLGCEIAYATAGTAMNGGLDRGRALAAMDAELLAAVRQWPKNAPKNSYVALANGGSAVPLTTRVWWGDVSFGPAKTERDRLMRTATVTVMCYQEAGEL